MRRVETVCTMRALVLAREAHREAHEECSASCGGWLSLFFPKSPRSARRPSALPAPPRSKQSSPKSSSSEAASADVNVHVDSTIDDVSKPSDADDSPRSLGIFSRWDTAQYPRCISPSAAFAHTPAQSPQHAACCYVGCGSQYPVLVQGEGDTRAGDTLRAGSLTLACIRPGTPPRSREPQQCAAGATVAYILGREALRKENEQLAVERLQAGCRGCLVRKGSSAKLAAAARLQALTRGTMARRGVAALTGACRGLPTFPHTLLHPAGPCLACTVVSLVNASSLSLCRSASSLPVTLCWFLCPTMQERSMWCQVRCGVAMRMCCWRSCAGWSTRRTFTRCCRPSLHAPRRTLQGAAPPSLIPLP